MNFSYVSKCRDFPSLHFSISETWENVLTGHADVKEVSVHSNGFLFMIERERGDEGEEFFQSTASLQIIFFYMSYVFLYVISQARDKVVQKKREQIITCFCVMKSV